MNTVASLIDLHMRAEDEICGAAVYGTESPGLALAWELKDAHEDVREIIREASLQPPGSPLWWDLAGTALSAWARQFSYEEHGPPGSHRDRAAPALRRRLALAWRAFREAYIRDLVRMRHRSFLPANSARAARTCLGSPTRRSARLHARVTPHRSARPGFVTCTAARRWGLGKRPAGTSSVMAEDLFPVDDGVQAAAGRARGTATRTWWPAVSSPRARSSRQDSRESNPRVACGGRPCASVPPAPPSWSGAAGAQPGHCAGERVLDERSGQVRADAIAAAAACPILER